jgi:hypothetical protein
MDNKFPPSVEVAKLQEKLSAKGVRYFAGYAGSVRICLLPGEPAADGAAVWRLLYQQATSKPDAADAAKKTIAAPRQSQTARRRSLPKAPPLFGPKPNPLPHDDVSDLWSEGSGHV